MFFKYNKYDLTEKNLYYLSMVSMLNVEVIVNQIFVVCAIIMVFQEKTIDKSTIIYGLILASFGYVFSLIDAIFRRLTLKMRIKRLNKALNVDMFSDLSGRQLDNDLIYKDKEWFIAVPSPECIIVNKNYMRKDIVIRYRNKGTEVTLHTIDGKKIEYLIDAQWKYMIDRLKKWMRET